MDKNSFDLITFGEIMLRLSPPRHARIVDGDIFEKRAGGAELNVASGVALLDFVPVSFPSFRRMNSELLSRTGSVLSEYPMTIWSTMIRRTQDSVSTTTRWAPLRESLRSCMTATRLPSQGSR